MVLIMYTLHLWIVSGMVLCLPALVMKMFLSSSQYLKKITVCVVQCFRYFGTCHHNVFFFWPCRKIIGFLFIFSIKWQIYFQGFVCSDLTLLRLLVYLSSVVVNLYCATINTQQLQPLTVWNP